MSCNRCKLVRWGRHRNGTPRWRCRICGQTRSREKPRPAYRLLRRYLIDGDTCEQLADNYQVHPGTVRRRLAKMFDRPPPLSSPADAPQPCWLITDATHFKRWGCLLITKATRVMHPLAVSFHERECFETAVKHLEPLKNLSVAGYTTDGKRGLGFGPQIAFPEGWSPEVLGAYPDESPVAFDRQSPVALRKRPAEIICRTGSS